MIKKFIVGLALCLACTNVLAQQKVKKEKKHGIININIGDFTNKTKSAVEEKIAAYSKKIDSLVVDEKGKMELEINAVTERVKSGEITQAEADSRNQEISEKYAAIIDEKIESFDSDLDEIIEKQIKESLTKNGGGDIEKTPEEIIANYKKKLKSTDLFLSYGYFGLTNGSEAFDFADSEIGYSNSWEIGLRTVRQFGINSGWSANYGLTFKWITLKPNDDLMFSQTDNNILELIHSDRSIDKSKLRATFLMLPVGFEYAFGKSKDAGKGVMVKDVHSGFKVGFGGYAGLRISTQRIVKYNQKENGDDKIKTRDNFNINDFRAGLKFSVGYNDWSLYLQKDLTDYFRSYAYDYKNGFEIGLAHAF